MHMSLWFSWPLTEVVLEDVRDGLGLGRNRYSVKRVPRTSGETRISSSVVVARGQARARWSFERPSSGVSSELWFILSWPQRICLIIFFGSYVLSVFRDIIWIPLIMIPDTYLVMGGWSSPRVENNISLYVCMYVYMHACIYIYVSACIALL